jgi:pyroglutamyl-peptidase
MRAVRALLTAFGPFLGRAANQSQSVLEHCLRRLPPRWRAELLPADLGWVRTIAAERAADPRTSAWLALGEAGVDGPPLLERCARNRYDLREDPDSAAGAPPAGELEAGGPPQLDSTLPLDALARAMQARGHEVALSADAGAHCCNALLYFALRGARARTPPPRIGFLHLPRRAAEAPRQAQLVLDALAWLDEPYTAPAAGT